MNSPISIHAPRVGSDHGNAPGGRLLQDFNPRSPCGERPALKPRRYGHKRFQSTLPVWGATLSGIGGVQQHRISIHAPRVGSDVNQ